MVPVPIQFGKETFLDGVDPAHQFYQRLADAPHLPSTSTPSPGSFLEVYRRLAKEASAIISIHVMGSKSTAVDVARMAAAMLPEVRIHVVDSQTTSLGLGLLTVAAARAAQVSSQVSEVLALVKGLIPQVRVQAAIRDLAQLRRSGRVSLGQMLMAGMLSVKPILYIGQGMTEVVDRARGWKSAVDRLVALTRDELSQVPASLAVVHTCAEAEARLLMERVRGIFPNTEMLVAEAGPALAVHAGQGALGLVTIPQC